MHNVQDHVSSGQDEINNKNIERMIFHCIMDILN